MILALCITGRRQAAITQEITEVCSGARAQKNKKKVKFTINKGDACVMEKGKIIQVSGPVIDVLFRKGNLPHIKDALTVDNHGKKCVMEVAKHMGTQYRPLYYAFSQ